MESRVAIIGIIVEQEESVEELNGILHGYGSYIIGRMGIPYPKRGLILSVLRWMHLRISSALFPGNWENWPG